MYTVFADDICIYDDKSPSDKIKLISPKLTLADNSAGSFIFTLPPTNIGYDAINRMQSEIIVKRDDTEIWSGRAITEDMDYWNQKNFKCEGELAYLNDILQPPAAYDDQTILRFLNAVINIYNQRASNNRQFAVGVVTVSEYSAARPYTGNITTTTNYTKTWDVIKNSLLDVYGGHIRVRKQNGTRYLDYLDDYLNTNTQEIDFHENLVDFTRNWDDSEYCTVVIPYGKKIEEKDDSKSGLSYKITKTRDEGRNTYTAEFHFTFNNPGVPEDYYVDILDDDGNPTGQQQLGSYDHWIWMKYWPESNPSNYRADLSETWTLKAGADTNKTWTKKVENLVPNTTYVWEAWVERTHAGGGGVMGYNDMGGIYHTGPHTMTASLTDGEVDGIEKHVTVEDVNNGSKYVENQNSVATRGRIEAVVTWDTIDDPAKLLAMANWYLTDFQYNSLIIQLSAFDMHYLNRNIESVKLFDKIRVISTPHGVDRTFPVTKLDIPLDSPENTVFTLGDKERDSYTKSQSKSSNDIYNRLAETPTTGDVMNQIGSSGYRMLVEAQQNAQNLIELGLNGFITITTDENGTNELWITPTRDYTQADQWWRWNMGGLGFGYKDYNDSGKVKYKLAMTMDGAIVADRITTGQMLVDRVRLYGLMGVYSSSSSTENEVPGGYIGYGEGYLGAGESGQPDRTTRGMMLSNTGYMNETGLSRGNRRYFITTSEGVRMQAGTQTFYLTDGDRSGNLSVEGNFGVRIGGELRVSPARFYPGGGDVTNKFDVGHSGRVSMGTGDLYVNNGFVVGAADANGYSGGSPGNEIQIGRANMIVVNGMITHLTPWNASNTAGVDDVQALQSALGNKANSSWVESLENRIESLESDVSNQWSWIQNNRSYIQQLSEYHDWSWG